MQKIWVCVWERCCFQCSGLAGQMVRQQIFTFLPFLPTRYKRWAVCQGAARAGGSLGSMGTPLGQAEQDLAGLIPPPQPASGAAGGSPGHQALPWGWAGMSAHRWTWLSGAHGWAGKGWGGAGTEVLRHCWGRDWGLGGAGMGSWAIGWVGEALGVGRDISALGAWTLSLRRRVATKEKLRFLLKKMNGVAV